MEFTIELEKFSSRTRQEIASSSNRNNNLILALKDDSDEAVRVSVALNPDVNDEVLTELANDDSIAVRVATALNPKASDVIQAKIAEDSDEIARATFALYTASEHFIKRLVEDKSEFVRLQAVLNRNIDDELALWIVQNNSMEKIRMEALYKYFIYMSNEKRLEMMENSSYQVRLYVVQNEMDEDILIKASKDECADIRLYAVAKTTNFDIINRLYLEDDNAEVIFNAWVRKHRLLLDELADCQNKCYLSREAFRNQVMNEKANADVLFFSWKRKHRLLLDELIDCKKKCDSSVEAFLNRVSDEKGWTKLEAAKYFNIEVWIRRYEEVLTDCQRRYDILVNAILELVSNEKGWTKLETAKYFNIEVKINK